MKCLLLDFEETNRIESFKANKLIADQFPNKDLSFQSQYDKDLEVNIEDKVNDITIKFNKYEEKILSYKKIINSLPKNATIREEFIKCGKPSCSLCPHGPYYYSYLRDKVTKKLRKKYLGVIDPRQ